MLDFKELSESLTSPYRVKEVTIPGSNKNTFRCTLTFEDKVLKETLGDCQWLVKELPESYYIHIWPEIDRLKTSQISHRNFMKLNQKLKFGHLKKLKDKADVISTCIFHSFKTDIIDKSFHKDFIIQIVKALISEFYQLMEKLEDLDEPCPDCDFELIDCLCEEVMETDEKTVKVCKELKKYKGSDIFDFSEVFYDDMSSEYFFNPGDLLENKLRTCKIPQDFESIIDRFIMDLDRMDLYLKRYPMNLLMYFENKNEKKLILAPALQNKGMFDKYFSLHLTEFDLKNEILKRISLNISPAPAAHDFLPLKNLKYNENPKISKIGEGNFYTLYENELLNGSKVLLKFPVSNENSRVEGEYQLTLECQNSGFLVTPIRLLKFGHKIGIVCEDLRGQLLQDQFMSMTTDQKVKIMKDIAECLQSIHSKGIYHLNITPKTIAISNKTKGKLLNMKYATKSSTITHFSYSSLMYTDPELLISRPAGFFTDVWSWAVTFISLFTELNPYSGVLTPELFQFQKKTTSFNILELSEQIHSEIIKNKKRPLIESLPLPEELISLLITCLSIPAENRPTMAEIVKKLRISSI